MAKTPAEQRRRLKESGKYEEFRSQKQIDNNYPEIKSPYEKAMATAKRSLPKCPTKRKIVVENLCQEYSPGTIIYEEFGRHFTATSHDKGAIDGLGGTLKHKMRDDTWSSNIDPYTAEEFITFFRKCIPKN
ncbi:hypothetical protein NPIL_617411 [Nephila pilipes]|uniref:Uncharacterized protein n=1 Tax=Nephila pilipes TaxID=299642 RepID=A0A8X6K4L6_NEPPI|nr:hypothetical protein NPIL_617411 [Nephila pilipes]